MSLPPAFAKRMRTLLGSEANALLDALTRPPVTGLRVNTLKLSREAFMTRSPWPLEPVPWCNAGFTPLPDAKPGRHPYHDAGLYYLQEPSAMAVAEALAPQPGEWVLDLAAAPGGKATHLAALMQGEGLLVANDISRGRSRAVAENLERWGSRHALVTSEAPQRLADLWGAVFDRVLLDAPCSGEGMFRKSADARAMWSERTVEGCARRQGELLATAATLVRPGGTLVYSTCTFAPEENEGVVARFLQAHDFELISVNLPGASPGRPDWLPPDPANADLTRTVRFWPHRVAGEGHFVARLQRVGGANQAPTLATFRPAPHQARQFWRSFVTATLPTDPAHGAQLTTFGNQLYAVPESVPTLASVRALRTGLWLGALHKDRLEPSHSLALALTPDEVTNTRRLALEPGDPRVGLYLQGHPLEAAGEAGWLLVTVSGFALGWGKRSQGVVKNAYPKGLRWA